MKRFALILALVLMLCGCTETPPPATSAPPQTSAPAQTTQPTETAASAATTLPPETTVPPETTLPPETTAPVESSAPSLSIDDCYALLDSTGADCNWLFTAMGCFFERPEQIDLETLFYNGFFLGSWDLLSPESQQHLIDNGFWSEMDIQPMPTGRIEEVLNDTFGISLSDCTIPEGWVYAEKEDYYCSNHNDAYGPASFTITKVEEHDGAIFIHYHPEYFYDNATGEFYENPDMIYGLQYQQDGTYHALFNILAF